jgi:hypothetical protein
MFLDIHPAVFEVIDPRRQAEAFIFMEPFEGGQGFARFKMPSNQK